MADADFVMNASLSNANTPPNSSPLPAMTDSSSSHVTLLLQTFSGLNLPSTLCIPISRTSSVHDAHAAILARLPPLSKSHYIVTTNSNRELTASGSLASLTSRDAPFIPLRLSLPLCGGKGGFGSQLRAAGGRMSSRKKRKNEPPATGSSRNLDGRRLRTVTEAKALAEYLATKPDMDRKEKEERRKRWEGIVEMAEQKTEEIKRGAGKARLEGEWAESREEANERTREAVRAAMRSGNFVDTKFLDGETKEGRSASTGSSEMEADEGESSVGTTPPEAELDTNGKGKGKGDAIEFKGKEKEKAVGFFGFDDEDDEFMSDDEDGDEAEEKS